jgi:Raf kinase inhibitor-like YbhB/YbcL family protein
MSLKLGNLKITSADFSPRGLIPKRNGGDGGNVSPALEWSGAPKGTKEFALVSFDYDAPLPRGFVHWVVYGIPASVTRLSEGQAPNIYTAGVNGTGKPGYMGPYPPNGHGVHHYYFWVYALDDTLKLKSGLNLEQLLDSIAPHILEQARIVGLYER